MSVDMEEVERRIKASAATKEEKRIYKKHLFHCYVKSEGEYKEIFQRVWMKGKEKEIRRLSLFKSKKFDSDHIGTQIQKDIDLQKHFLNSNPDLLYLTEIQWLCEMLHLKHPHDQDAIIERTWVEALIDNHLGRLDQMSQIFVVDPVIRQNNDTNEQHPRLEEKAQRVVDFLNRILRYFLCELNVHKKRKRGTIDGRRVDITPYVMNVEMPFYDILHE
jgi:hypothetical protein